MTVVVTLGGEVGRGREVSEVVMAEETLSPRNWRASSRVAGRSIWAEKLKKKSGPTQPEKFWSLRPPRKTGLRRSVGTSNLSLRMDSLRGARRVSKKIEWRRERPLSSVWIENFTGV